MGINCRSVIAVYQEVWEEQQKAKAQKGSERLGKAQEKPSNTPSSWRKASKDFNWGERAAGWDAHLRRQHSLEKQNIRQQEMEDARKRAKTMASATLATMTKLLTTVNNQIDKLEKGDIPVKSIPSFVRAIAAAINISIEVEAHALDLREISEQLEDAMEDFNG